MPEASTLPPRQLAVEPFPSFAELWRAHLSLRQSLLKGDVDIARIAADIRAFIASARATGALLGQDNERKTAQGILDYWLTELVGLPGATETDYAPAMLDSFGEGPDARQPRSAADVEKEVEDESREFVRIAALARQYRESGKQYGYLLLDKVAIAQAARFRTMDSDVDQLVTDSEEACRAAERRKRVLVYGLSTTFLVVVVGAVMLYLWALANEAETTARVAVESVESILNVVSTQTENQTIPIAAATELFERGDGILKLREQQEAQRGVLKPVVEFLQRGRDVHSRIIGAHVNLLARFSDIYIDAGNSKKVIDLAERGEKLAEQLVRQKPGEDDWQKLVYKCAFRIGDAVVTSDDKRARDQYDLALKIAQTIADKDPGNTYGQRDLTFIMNKEGDLDLMARAWEKAAFWYGKSLDIGRGLKPSDPQERRVASKIVGDAWARLAGLSAEQAHYDDALRQYQEALNIRHLLVQQTPRDDKSYDVYQGNLASTYDFIGDVYKNYYAADGRSELLDRALEQYDEALRIRQSLVDEDPANTSRQYLLQHEFVAFGDVLMLKQDVSGAIAKYREAQRIRELLSVNDPDNVPWKANLASAHEKLATALVRDQQFDAATTEYDAALEVRKDLAARFPENRSRQLQLATAYEQKGDGLAARGNARNDQSDLRDAAEAYRVGLTVVDAYLRKDPKSRLEPVRDRLQKKIDALTASAQ